jgi:hypothetical protein
MTASMAVAAAGRVERVTRHSNALTTVETARPGDYHRIGGGFLEVVYVANLPAINDTLDESVQTIVHAGFEGEQIQRFALGLPAHCVTRIVPVGRGLDFDVVWDGYDLFGELTQLLQVR